MDLFCTQQGDAIPAFIISYNRGSMLVRCIESLQRLSQNIVIVVLDNGSSDKRTQGILDEVEDNGIEVLRLPAIELAGDLNKLAPVIQQKIQKYNPGSGYIVTDCDIDVSSCDDDLISILQHMLNLFPDIQCAGPMLRIRDIPSTNPIRNHAMNRHIDQFWGKLPSFISIDSRTIAFQLARIDTTFALHRAGQPFHRLKEGIRLYTPFEARHLDWYPCHWEAGYEQTSSSGISHWHNSIYIANHLSDSPKHSHYYDITVNDCTSAISIVERKTSIIYP